MSRWSWRARIDARRPERRLLWSALIPCGVLILLSRWTDGWAGWPESAKVAAGYGALFFGLHGALVVLRPRADMLLLPLVSVPCGIGLALLNRMDPLLAGRQLLALAAGGVALVAVAVAAPRAPSHIAPVLGAGAVATLLLTAALGSEAGGARAWLSVAGLRFLPVEAAKLVLVWCWGVMLSRGMSPWLVVSTAALASAGLVAQNEFGYPLILFVTAIAMIYAATGRRGWLVGSLAAAVPLGFFAGDLPHVRNRVTAWLDPWADPLGAGYQALQGMFALSEGGLFGRAIGAGFPELLPAAHTDYILASVGEELGLAGQLSVLGACGLLVARAFAIARRAPGKRERLVSAGLGVLLGLQAVWMAGGVTRLLPLSGLGMPWLSYGGSAALENLAAGGLLAAASRPTRHPEDPVRWARIAAVGKGLAAAGVVVSCAFGYWQLARPDLKVHPLNPRPAARSPLANRGGIFDRHGEAVALTVSSGGRTERAVRSPGLIHVVGYSDPRYGFAGIESAYNADLAGLGRGFGDWLRDPLRMRPQGRDVWLTIDARVQEAAENALGRRPGAVVAVRPRTGEILAMVSYPAYSPAELPRILAGEIPGAPLLNRATQGLYPPGSTFKLVTLAAALEAGLVPTARERATYQRALAVSSNPDFAELGLQLGARELASVASRIGFGARLPLELPANVSPLPAATDAGELAQVSIGQGGLVATPLQMAVAVAAVANGGVVMKPHIVLEVREPSGRLARFTRVEPLGDPAFSVATARAVTEAMVLAVEEGTARQARLPGRRVAGKTGTAENPHGAPHAWFVGFAPAYRPEVAVAVVVENGGSGGAVAAPIGRAVLLAALLADRPPEVSP